MRLIVINKTTRKVTSVTDIPVEYEYSPSEGEELVVGHEDYIFDLMQYEYLYEDGLFVKNNRDQV